MNPCIHGHILHLCNSRLVVGSLPGVEIHLAAVGGTLLVLPAAVGGSRPAAVGGSHPAAVGDTHPAAVGGSHPGVGGRLQVHLQGGTPQAAAAAGGDRHQGVHHSRPGQGGSPAAAVGGSRPAQQKLDSQGSGLQHSHWCDAARAHELRCETMPWKYLPTQQGLH
jgi:hypothetical protein